MKLLQLNPALPVVTPLGKALAVILQGDDWDVYWCCFQIQTGECWWWGNHLIRLETNITTGRLGQSKIVLDPDLKKALAPHLKRYNLTKEKSP